MYFPFRDKLGYCSDFPVVSSNHFPAVKSKSISLRASTVKAVRTRPSEDKSCEAKIKKEGAGTIPAKKLLELGLQRRLTYERRCHRAAQGTRFVLGRRRGVGHLATTLRHKPASCQPDEVLPPVREYSRVDHSNQKQTHPRQ
jgi:hypothetical protein